MAITVQGLGKGLDALIRETRGEQPEGNIIRSISIDCIEPNPAQPRRNFSEGALADLAASIASQGVLQPILVRPLPGLDDDRYQIVAGERRWRASKLAGLSEIPVIVKEFTDLEVLAVALIENLQREDLNPIEEALAFQTLKADYGLSQEELAQKLGKSRSAVANSLRLLALPESLREDLAEGRITSGHARAILSVSSEAAQLELKDMIVEKNLSVREAEALASLWKRTGAFVEAEAEKVARQPVKQNVSDDNLSRIQTVLNSVFQVPIQVTGRESKGKISFCYNSREELLGILSKLGASSSFEKHAEPEEAALKVAEAILNGTTHSDVGQLSHDDGMTSEADIAGALLNSSENEGAPFEPVAQAEEADVFMDDSLETN